MKKFLLLLAVIMTFAMSSCSGAGKADEIAQKIENGETLSQNDYKEMIQYVEKATDIMLKAFENMDDPEKLGKATEELAKKYPHADLFGTTLITDYSKLDAENRKTFDDLNSQYQD